ncbi:MULTISPECIES: hypothetical protein [unclassified Oleiphilus]|uniref:hypothetical protein n=2 Tax=Oleiphilus TaxID=141450 RepID=UPI0007C346C3|nr:MULTISPECIES: hypothetical protein [unclassified Oleiphilus]KZY46020.1 hypothetical protein A3732_08400 [Oleiphilus sp. HI0050]KZY75260.1 hypothetical protein A3740_15570 [Oleiphilus sp. HI0068]KZY81289.1 hypothetical protein A3741_04605 [Oleiphilus sp. HI0069]KZY85992.1 hypothetical protein A3743_18035 [Oleiphilus sp. HI0072]KZZ08488.1 hypothetical protein A3749_14385 [Oleiphilus sp. HI0078]KZZ30436.1 hypothetical protein A3755_02010 [Oleiphilus sp. HI0085]
MTKPIAFLIHFLISLAIVSIVYFFIRFQIYPDFYFKIQGISEIILILFAVDVILGPLLTFVVYKKGKKSLKFDLSVIALFQIAALVYGFQTIYKERPLSALLVNNSFEIQTASNYDMTAVDPNIIDTSLASAPKFHVLTGTTEVRIAITVHAFTGEGDTDYLQNMDYYHELGEQKERIKQAALEEVYLKKIYKDQEFDTGKYFYIRIIGKSGFGLAKLDKNTYEVLEIFALTDFDMNTL